MLLQALIQGPELVLEARAVLVSNWQKKMVRIWGTRHALARGRDGGTCE